MAEDTPRIEGKAKVGKTELSGNLEGTLRDDRLFLVGAIRSERLYLHDLRALVDVFSVEGSDAVKNVDTTDEFAKDLAVELEIDVKRIAGADKAVGKISGKLLYDKEIVTIDPLQVSYLGGVISAVTKIDTSKKAPLITASGKVTKLPVGRMLRELGAPPVVTGSLTTTFKIAGSGSSAASIARTLSGSVTASI